MPLRAARIILSGQWFSRPDPAPARLPRCRGPRDTACGIIPVAGPVGFAYTARSVGAWRSPVSALVWGTRGRGFESRRSDHCFHVSDPDT